MTISSARDFFMQHVRLNLKASIPSIVLMLLVCSVHCNCADDATDLKGVVDKFFELYAKKNLDAFMALWSEKSPDYATRKKTMQELFTGNDHSFLNLSISHVKVDTSSTPATRASLRATVDLSVVNAQTKQTTSERLIRTFTFVREDIVWKVWRYSPASDELAAALVAAKSDGERQSLLTAEKELVSPDLVRGLRMHGIDFVNQGKNAEAQATFQIARSVAEQIGDKPGVALSLYSLGIVQTNQGNYAEALESYQKSLTINESLDNKQAIALILNNIGIVNAVQGNYATALSFYEKSLAMNEAMGNKADQAMTLNNIGNVHKDQGNYSKALESYQKSLEMTDPYDKFGIIITLSNIGSIHYAQGNNVQAMEFYQKSLDISEAIDYKAGMVPTLIRIGNVQSSQRNLAQALELYEKSLAISEMMGDKNSIALIMYHIGDVHRSRGNYEQALQYYQKSRTMSDALGIKVGIAASLISISKVHGLQGNYAEALDDANQALNQARQIGARELLWEALYATGQAQRAVKQPEKAQRSFEQAIDVIESLKGDVAGGEDTKSGFLVDKLEVYNAMVEVLLELNRPDEALKYIERAKSKQLLDTLQIKSLQSRDPRLRNLLQQSQRLQEQVSAQERLRGEELAKPKEQQNQTKLGNLSALIANTKAELLTVWNDIKAVNPGYERYLTVRPQELSEIQQNLTPGNLVLAYAPLDKGIAIFLVTDRDIQLRFVTVSRESLYELVRDFRREMKRAGDALRAGRQLPALSDLNSESAKNLRQILGILYGYLVLPVRDQIDKAEVVTIVPSGLLYYVPFAALGKENADGSFSFLLESKRINYLTSLSLERQIARLRPRALRANDSVGIFANPDGSLKAAEEEGKAISAIFPSSLLYVGKEATEMKVRDLPQRAVVAHFATHGVLNSKDVNESYLLLATEDAVDRNKDGKLSLPEIYGLEGVWSVQLVVLSACETGIGEEEPGADLSSIADAFVQAGSRTIVASLWRVADASTAQLMKIFYGELSRGEGKSESLRKAQLEMIKDKQWAHPYFWAPFVLIGDWR